MQGVSIYRAGNYIWTDSKSTKLGGGTFGKVQVHKGHRTDTGEFVAIKVFKLPKDVQDQADYMGEWANVRDLQNDCIVRYYTMEEFTNTKNNKTYQILVMELADGTVRDELNKPEHYLGLPSKDLFTIIDNCVEALRYLDSKKMAHRKLQPENILIFKKPRLRCKLCDFGGACFLKYSIERMTEKVGSDSPGYLESASVNNMAGGPTRGYNKDERDMWGSSCCFFECAAGRQPFTVRDGRSENVGFKSLSELLTPRENDNGPVVWGERIRGAIRLDDRNYYHYEMPLQHHSYSRGLKSLLAQFFKLVFAKNKLYLHFDTFYHLCQTLISLGLNGHKFYNVSELCIDEYIDVTGTPLFSGGSFYDAALGESTESDLTVEMMQGITAVIDPLLFQPTDEETLDQLVVWKSNNRGEMVISEPALLLQPWNYPVGTVRDLMVPLNSNMDPRIAVGMMIQMQMHEQQIRQFHDVIRSFCHTGDQTLRFLFSRALSAEWSLSEAMKQFSIREAPAAGNSEYEQRISLLAGLTAERIRAVINAQEELSGMTGPNELENVDVRLIEAKYAEAQTSLRETMNLVYRRVASDFGKELLRLHLIFKEAQQP